MKLLTLALLVVAIGSGGALAQSGKSVNRQFDSKKTCSKDYAFSFLKFEKMKRDDFEGGEDRVWLEFKNTSARKMSFRASDTQTSWDYLNGKGRVLSLYYDVVDKIDCDSPNREILERPNGYSRREAYYHVTLLPGQSFRLNVDKAELNTGRAVSIEYDVPKGGGSDTRMSYFFADDIANQPLRYRVTVKNRAKR